MERIHYYRVPGDRQRRNKPERPKTSPDKGLLAGRHPLAGVIRSALALLTTSGVYFGVLTTQTTSSEQNLPNLPATQTISLDRLNRSIYLAEGYLDGLYKPDSAVMSETYNGFPQLSVGRDNTGGRQMPGENRLATTRLIHESETQESVKINFYINKGSLATPNSPLIKATINWQAPTIAFFTITNERYLDPTSKAYLYLGKTYLGELNQNNIGQEFFIPVNPGNRQLFQSFRYTLRHATPSGMFFNRLTENPRSKDLAQTLLDHGFLLDFDLSAPIVRAGTEYPEDFVDSQNIYQDCNLPPEKTASDYRYRSKVCLAPNVYIFLTHFDTLVPSIRILHQLNRDRLNNANANPLLPPQIRSAVIALENQFDNLGFGMPKCSPLGCHELASAIRTANFAALETGLYERYHRPESRIYAARAISFLLGSQIGEDGLLHTYQGDLYRLIQKGGFYMSWNQNSQYAPDNPFPDSAIAIFGMQPEDPGTIPSNFETTFYAWAALLRYRCEEFGVGCFGS